VSRAKSRKGPQVMAGYWKPAGRDRECRKPTGYFRTGDIGRDVPDGDTEDRWIALKDIDPGTPA